MEWNEIQKANIHSLGVKKYKFDIYNLMDMVYTT